MTKKKEFDITIFCKGDAIEARPVPKGHVCKVTSLRPTNPIVSHPYIQSKAN